MPPALNLTSVSLPGVYDGTADVSDLRRILDGIRLLTAPTAPTLADMTDAAGYRPMPCQADQACFIGARRNS